MQVAERPPVELVVSDPARGIRPYLPAGFGSGFERGRMPYAALLRGEHGDELIAGLVGAEEAAKAR